MRSVLFFCLLVFGGFVSELGAQNCAGIAYGNTVAPNGRYFIMTYEDQFDRNTALANINSITINGMTYPVAAHPTGTRSIRTTVAQPSGTFPSTFTGVVTLNPSGETCEYFASALPVTLANINAVKEESAVVIKWETTQEIYNDGFEIQQSTDGRNFETFTWVEGAGSTNQAQYYKVVHPDYSRGINYYRLKQIDFDGGFEFSPIVTVNIESDNLLKLERNALIQGQELNILSSKTEAFEVFDLSGNKVSSGYIEIPNQVISTAGFNSGMYFIRTEGGTILKFIIQ